ncbi:MAG TPA: hypothetical protein VFD36_29860 [Kofleriaceae bacterium]|nr:hypothetical protein [Kofleriaceae bacterium]
MRSLVIGVLCIASSDAVAGDSRDADLDNVMVGPVFGIRLGGPPTASRGVLGFEGGIGKGPERINLGFEHRGDTSFAYIELDPWLFVGASLGLGVDSNGETHPVLGLWEGFPVVYPGYGCNPDETRGIVTVALGYRYTGIHELYMTIKAGVSEPLCF